MGITDQLARILAKLPSGRPRAKSEIDPVLQRLRDQGFWILAKAGKQDTQPGHIDFFDYFENGNHIWPIFTAQEEANQFFTKFIAPEQVAKGKMVSCEVLGLKIDVLLTNDFSKSKILLDPKLPGEREITQSDLQALRKNV